MHQKDILLDLPEIVDDRGSLCVAESTSLPFRVKRVFWLYGIHDGKTRGGHAHKSCEEIVFPLRGSFEMYVDDGKEETILTMCRPTQGIYIRKGVWCELRNFSPDTICLVLASEPYNPDGYINDYKTFKLLAKGTKQ